MIVQNSPVAFLHNVLIEVIKMRWYLYSVMQYLQNRLR